MGEQAETSSADTTVYYSTPFGETSDGEQRLFLLERDGMRYFPVFRTVESIKEFYAQRDRVAYAILKGNVQDVMETTRSIELLKGTGIVIEPLSEHPVEILPDA
ncbi:SseB family protein [Mycolicibacter longobardus]|uniref:SseB family protein n=1 Tax=Mycolicibacter longobardus TaxID=1108812 RepID=UPI000A16BF9D|nr:SseB family protein [Mycolicibacter longobardus]MCV7386385.1 SseB family protein [Mycolicibacter longobardus]